MCCILSTSVLKVNLKQPETFSEAWNIFSQKVYSTAGERIARTLAETGVLRRGGAILPCSHKGALQHAWPLQRGLCSWACLHRSQCTMRQEVANQLSYTCMHSDLKHACDPTCSDNRSPDCNMLVVVFSFVVSHWSLKINRHLELYFSFGYIL